MRLHNELESYEMSGLDPVPIISVPRILGINCALLCLSLIFNLTAIIGGHAVTWIATNVPVGDLLDQVAKALTPTDITVGILKALCFGTLISVTSLYRGFTIPRQTTHLPAVVSKAAIEALLYVVTAGILISLAFYL